MQKLTVALWIAAPPVVIALLAIAFGGFDRPVSLSAGSTAWRFVDEFGRNTFGTLALAVLLSLAKGLAITSAVAILSSVLAYVAILGDQSWARPVLRGACAVIESVPLVLWIVIVAVSVKGPRLWVTMVAFGVLVLPPITQIILGEFARLKSLPFVEAAYLLGLSETRVFARYVLPAAVPVLIPVFTQVLGNAIAIDGAISVFGLGSRSDVDLGVFLLRGKEQFVSHPELLILALLAYGVVYLYLQWLAYRSNSGIFPQDLQVAP